MYKTEVEVTRISDTEVRVSSRGSYFNIVDKRGISDKRLKKIAKNYSTIYRIKNDAQDIINRMSKPHAFGHAFLWGTFIVDGKTYKDVLGSGAASNWHEIEAEVKSRIPEIKFTYINLD